METIKSIKLAPKPEKQDGTPVKRQGVTDTKPKHPDLTAY